MTGIATHLDDATGLHPTAQRTCRAALAAQHRSSRRLHGLRRESSSRYPALQARIREIEDLLTNAVVGEDAVFDPVAEPGMVLTIRYDDTGETETFLLGRRDVEDAGIKVYSTASPLGRAIAGARPGDQRIYAVPNETGAGS